MSLLKWLKIIRVKKIIRTDIHYLINPASDTVLELMSENLMDILDSKLLEYITRFKLEESVVKKIMYKSLKHEQKHNKNIITPTILKKFK